MNINHNTSTLLQFCQTDKYFIGSMYGHCSFTVLYYNKAKASKWFDKLSLGYNQR